MSIIHIHLDSLETLEQYRHKLENWKRQLYALNDEMRVYHNSLEQDQKWSGRSHVDFNEKFIGEIYPNFLQPAAEMMDEGQNYLRQLQSRAEELGIR